MGNSCCQYEVSPSLSQKLRLEFTTYTSLTFRRKHHSQHREVTFNTARADTYLPYFLPFNYSTGRHWIRLHLQHFVVNSIQLKAFSSETIVVLSHPQHPFGRVRNSMFQWAPPRLSKDEAALYRTLNLRASTASNPWDYWFDYLFRTISRVLDLRRGFEVSCPTISLKGEGRFADWYPETQLPSNSPP